MSPFEAGDSGCTMVAATGMKTLKTLQTKAMPGPRCVYLTMTLVTAAVALRYDDVPANDQRK